MNIQPLVNLTEEQFEILQRVSLEHNVTAEQYLSRICANHCSVLVSLEEEDMLSWSGTDARS